ncbi:MAG: hypothetical protein WC657_09570 [Candidatus Paceibacterota bacterium]|jgi:uncharacterized membrane protein YesL
MKDSPPPIVIAYFIVWVALAIFTAIVYRIRRDAEFRIKWHARLSLSVGILILGFMFLLAPSWESLLFIGGFGGFIIFLNISMTTICKSCGRMIQAIGVIHRAKHCPHCGGETARSRILNSINK